MRAFVCASAFRSAPSIHEQGSRTMNADLAASTTRLMASSSCSFSCNVPVVWAEARSRPSTGASCHMVRQGRAANFSHHGTTSGGVPDIFPPAFDGTQSRHSCASSTAPHRSVKPKQGPANRQQLWLRFSIHGIQPRRSIPIRRLIIDDHGEGQL